MRRIWLLELHNTSVQGRQARCAKSLDVSCVANIELTYNASRIANCQTIGWDVPSHDAARTNSGVSSDVDAGEDYYVRADPHMIFDNNWCGWRCHLTLFDAMLVPINNQQVMAQQTVSPNLDLFVCRD
jgi:hypothetical protein